MVWAYDAADFEYDDWSPYAVFEGDDVLVVRSEGDYFFALRTDAAQERWQPLPMQSDDPEDLERLLTVAARLLDIVSRHLEQPGPGVSEVAGRGTLAYEDDGFRAYRQSSRSRDHKIAGSYELYTREGGEWRPIDDYDTLWGFVQQVTAALMRLRNDPADES